MYKLPKLNSCSHRQIFINKFFPDLELPSCPPEPEDQTESTSSELPEESLAGETNNDRPVPMNLSVISDMTDSDPPSPVTEAPGIPIGAPNSDTGVQDGGPTPGREAQSVDNSESISSSLASSKGRKSQFIF